MRKETIEKTIEQLCQPLAASHDLEIVQVQYRREALGWILRVYIDGAKGVSINDCEVFSRELSHVLDFEDPIDGNYHLEVSSPGLDRPLVKPDDFNRFAGREITLKTRNAVDGRKNFKGILNGLHDDRIILNIDGRQCEIEWSLVEKANLVPVLEALSPNIQNQAD